MKTHIATTALLVALASVALAPAASASITVDVDNPVVDCESQRIGTGPAFQDEAYTEDCDVHAEKNNPHVDCRTAPLGTGNLFGSGAGTDGRCNFFVSV